MQRCNDVPGVLPLLLGKVTYTLLPLAAIIGSLERQPFGKKVQ